MADPVGSFQVPRFTRLQSVARLSRLKEMGTFNIAVMGAPFDASVSYRPDTWFGPAAIRAASQLLRPHRPGLNVEVFSTLRIAHAGDVKCSPCQVQEAVASIKDYPQQLLDSGYKIVAVVGDHTIAFPRLQTVTKKCGTVALLHFDAHLKTWSAYFNAEVTHRAVCQYASEEDLPDPEAFCDVTIRASLYAKSDIIDDQRMEFGPIITMGFMRRRVDNITAPVRARVGRPSPLHRHQRPRPHSCTRHRDSKGWLHHHSGTSRDTSRPG
jgi:agmatinase